MVTIAHTLGVWAKLKPFGGWPGLLLDYKRASIKLEPELTLFRPLLPPLAASLTATPPPPTPPNPHNDYTGHIGRSTNEIT